MALFGATQSWPLWEDDGDTRAGFSLADERAAVNDIEITEVTHARCFHYAPAAPNGRAILVLAGGGYTKLVIGKEGIEIAHWLAALGFHAFVLAHRFPCAASAKGDQSGAQAPVDDAMEAMRQIRVRAPVLGISSESVGALGLSSGGHLAACLVSRYPAHWSARPSSVASFSSRPDFLIVGYGPISTNAVGRQILANKAPLPPPEKQALYDAMQPDAYLIETPPPTFLVYAADDPIVPVENGRRLHAAFEGKGARAELHIFAHAPHGFALCEPNLPVGKWPHLCAAWLRQIGQL